MEKQQNQAERIKALEEKLAAETAKRKQLELQLQRAVRRAEAADRAKESFIANTNHELHTPLNAILGYTELLLEDIRAGYTETIEADLAKILEAGVRLLNIVNQLLDLSKIETDQSELKIEEFDVTDLVGEVILSLEETPAITNNELAVNIHPEIDTMAADVYKMRQILTNLLSNAGKFTSEGSIELAVVPLAHDGIPGIQFCVKDSGIGMIPAQTKNIFQAFTQADTSSTRHYEGLGLGLHICWRFCQMMGGSIDVTSELGEGSTFTVWLPKEVIAK